MKMIMNGIKEEGKSLSNYHINPDAPIKFFSPVGCDKCNNTGYKGRIGIHEVLRRQGLLEGTWTLNRNEMLSPGQKEEIDRVYKAYPHLNDDFFVAENLDRWLK